MAPRTRTDSRQERGTNPITVRSVRSFLISSPASTVAEIVAGTGLTRQTVSHAVDRMAEPVAGTWPRRWVLESMPAGTYKVHVELAGFAPVDLEETVGAGEATELTYRMSSASDEMEIVVGGERPPREVTRRRLERREIERIPGTSGDALRSLQSLPGVARPPALAGLLIVRGSAPQDTNTFVDGTNVLSRRLSSEVQQTVIERLRQDYGAGQIRDLGPKTALFYVLVSTRMPSILFESGFVSNPEDERRLRTPHYQQLLADALVEAVERWFEVARGRLARQVRQEIADVRRRDQPASDTRDHSNAAANSSEWAPRPGKRRRVRYPRR